jgi:membrane protein
MHIIRQSFISWFKDDAPSMGAAIAFYTLFAIAPILLIVIWMAGAFLGADVVQAHILAQMHGFLGEQGTAAVRALLASAAYTARSRYSTAAEVATLLIGASSVFAELQNALNRIWRTPPRHGLHGLWTLIRARLLSLGFISVIGFLLLVSLIASAGFEGLVRTNGVIEVEWQRVISVARIALGFALTALMFALIYKYVPDERISWRDIWVGAAVTAALFMAGKLLIVVYLGRVVLASAYGIAGSFLVLLLWVYYAAMVFLLGAEFTCAYAYAHGSRTAAGDRIVPTVRAPSP